MTNSTAWVLLCRRQTHGRKDKRRSRRTPATLNPSTRGRQNK